MRYLSTLIAIFFTSFSLCCEPLLKNELCIETSKHEGAYEVSATMQVTFSPAEFLSIVDDSINDCSWFANCEKVELLYQHNNIKIIRSTLNVAWPFKDRDMIVTTMTTVTPESLRIVLTDNSDFLPQQDNYVRMTNVSGEWQMKASGQNRYLLSYVGSASPNGVIPDWFAIQILADSTEQTFIALTDRLGKQP